MEWGAACQSAPLEGVAGRRALAGASAGALPQGGGREEYYRYCRHHPLLALLLLVLALLHLLASLLALLLLLLASSLSPSLRLLSRVAPIAGGCSERLLFVQGPPGRPLQRQQLGSGGDLRAAPSEGGHSGARGRRSRVALMSAPLASSAHCAPLASCANDNDKLINDG